MKRRTDNTAISEMYCTNCGKKGISIPRKDNRYREPGHLKNLYCIYCHKECNHVEIRPFYSDYNYEDFQLEMKYNNFDENGKRKEPYKIFREKLA
jgi:hypothetical protein